MIGSTSPYYAHRWLPLGHNGFLPDQPRVSVHLSIPEAFSGPDPGYLCFTHILQVKPIKRFYKETPDSEEIRVSIMCMNLDEVLKCHKKYWQKQRAVTGRDESSEPDTDHKPDTDHEPDNCRKPKDDHDNGSHHETADGMKICNSNFQFYPSETPVHLRLQIPKIRTDKVDGVLSWDPDATEAEKKYIINAAKMATEHYPSHFPDEVSDDGTDDEAVDESYEYDGTDELDHIPKMMEFYAPLPLIVPVF
jgi:hypothetical protein